LLLLWFPRIEKKTGFATSLQLSSCLVRFAIVLLVGAWGFMWVAYIDECMRWIKMQYIHMIDKKFAMKKIFTTVRPYHLISLRRTSDSASFKRISR
jgi:hypothetical protein